MLRLIPLLLVLLATFRVAQAEEPDPDQIVAAAQAGLEKIMSDPETAIPSTVFGDAHGLLIWPEDPSVQFVAGGKFQHCVLVTRKSAGGEWNPPQFMKYRLGSLGAQAGYTRSTIVRVYLTRKRLETVRDGVHFHLSIGGRLRWQNDAEQVARGASNSNPNATELTYSKGTGLTAGLIVQAEHGKIDQELGSAYYSQSEMPETVHTFLAALAAFDVGAKGESVSEPLAGEQPTVTQPTVTPTSAVQPTGPGANGRQAVRLPATATDESAP